MVALQMVIDEKQAVTVAIYPACYAVIAAGGVVDVYGVAKEGMAREESYAAALQCMVGCGVEPGFMVGKESFVNFLQADDVCIGCVDKSD